MSEAATVLRCQRGDRAAFVDLFTGYRAGAYRYCTGMLGSPEDAMDVVHEAFLVAFKGIGRVDPERGFAGWFYGVLRHLCLATLRHRRVEVNPDLLTRVSDPGPSPESQTADAERRAALTGCLARLTAVQREVILLREFEGLAYREIAERLEVPIGTVMSRLYEARRALVREMREQPALQPEVTP
jgi:RNA polymerase sigma-70 factor (ECF subfamily)